MAVRTSPAGPSPAARKKPPPPPRPPPPKKLPEQYQFWKPGSALSQVKSPNKVSPGRRPSFGSPSPSRPLTGPTQLRKVSEQVTGSPRPSPVPLPRQRRYQPDVGVVSAPVAKPRSSYAAKPREIPSPVALPRSRIKTNPKLLSPTPLPRTPPCTRTQPVAPRVPNSHSLSSTNPPVPPMTRTNSLPKLVISNNSPVQSKRRQPPRPPVGPRSQNCTASLQPSQTFNTLPKPSKVDRQTVELPSPPEETDSLTLDAFEDNVYSTVDDALLENSFDSYSHLAPLYAVPDEESVYAGLIAATKDLEDSDYVALRPLPADEQVEKEMEEESEQYADPSDNPLYMAMDPHTMQVDLPYQDRNSIINPSHH